ncbi:lytic murein transglycosylase [Aggregatibacter actinomycetemcomitans]|uniref:lytic murein transglycosylase n=2 Tax=Aggregatibacter actinomycetemcomitans TaxID=714 RepID=UPI0002DE1F54|nr:lytic murein transglycosylase [Aggregatibacter actinomycetemcomitans]KOE66282.1 lytic transglycosylase [Aggregatibacter actinomycetemcomitans serotype e str. SCC393]KOE67775.1 lytic transglycosylase [Aggregatibacter actinomycetemcomitans serotype e str. A160]KYK73760.1 lytic transglycosylase [Aggregatibacter actinomycetemcomitans serotype e str. SA2876]
MMKLNYILKISGISTALFLAGCSSNSNTPAQPSEPTNSVMAVNPTAVYSKPRTLDNFNDYVNFLKAKASAEGVSADVLNAQNNINYIQKSADLDDRQAGRIRKRDPNVPPIINPNGMTNYLNRVLTKNKVDTAEARYWEQLPQLENASKKFGVPKNYLLALWGMESSFGYYQGNYDVLSTLATLAFDGRREALFSKEFIAAMKMLQRDHIQRHKMLGSWAGAMGQTQFMPSSYLSYAADGNNDGEKNIWTNHYDVFASIANYLHTVGWNENLPWGVEVALTQPLDMALAGTEDNKKRTLRDWQNMGVTLKYQTPQTQQKLTALSGTQDLWLVRPDRELGRAFLVSNNYRTLLHWNKSNYFAVSIGMFADRIEQRVR